MTLRSVLGENVDPPEAYVTRVIGDFSKDIPTFESMKGLQMVLLQDGASKAYYTACHIDARIAVPLLDLDAAIDPEQQEEYRLQRALQPQNRAFQRMCSDALIGRQFSDLIAEYDTAYREERPLKLLGGQHRAVAIERALKTKRVSRYHGFKIYFALTREQRSEIAQVANTNIAISLDILDRIQETTMGSNLRDFCHKAGLLRKKEDFADRKNPEGRITVRLARTFLVNFFLGKQFKAEQIDGGIFHCYICRTGAALDPKYKALIRDRESWKDNSLIEAGRQFAALHKAQMKAIQRDPNLRKYVEFRNKAVTISMVASWSHVAGLLQRDKSRLNKLYSLSNLQKADPLRAREMSEARHITDSETYRGLGTRTYEKERGRLSELFLQFSRSESRVITGELIDSAIKTYEANVAIDTALKARKRARLE